MHVFPQLLHSDSLYISSINQNVDSLFLGTTVLNRDGNKEKNTLGMFVNTAPFLVELEYDNTFAYNVEKTGLGVVALFRHQKYNYSDILAEIRSEYKFTKRLFDVLINYQNARVEGTHASLDWYPNGNQVEALQIHILLKPNDGSFTIHYDYQLGKLTSEDIEVLHKRVCQLVFDGITHLEKPLYQLEIMDDIEKDTVLHRFNDTNVDFPHNRSVYSLFDECVSEFHNKTYSIIDGKNKHSLWELRRDAEIIDATIRTEKKQIIGVLCDRSYLELAAIYGIVRGGNAYMPISPDYPAERIQLLKDSSGCQIILSQRKYQHLTESLVIEDILLNHRSVEPLPIAASAEDTLYVIFTSGSTGLPKGAMISNRSAINRINWMAKKYFDHSTVVMLKTPYTFDVSVWEIFGFAICGFSLYILPPDDHYRQDKVLQQIASGGITDIHFVPSVFNQFLVALQGSGVDLPSLRHVFLSGEALTAAQVNCFMSNSHHEATIHNLYGPTECAVDVTYYDCKPIECDPVPIGKPIDNCSLLVLNKFLRPVPIKVMGQIAIAGVNVGKGYVNDITKTDERFIDNPYGDGKLYLTGDIGYWRADGNLVYVGRNDQQVKINGQRVELGEIEAVLSSIDGMRSVAVIVLNQKLVAYYTGDTTVDLRTAMGQRLPRHMIPSSFIPLNQFPLTSSGKIDKKALSRMTVSESSLPYDPPKNELERKIANLFMDVLHIERVGRNDNFYDLGGSSLDLMEMLCIPPLDILSSSEFLLRPTPAELASYLENYSSKSELLSPLYLPSKRICSYVLFPFAGGDASAYTALVGEFRKRDVPVALYFTPWLNDYKSAAEEIIHLCEVSRVRFYSHCAGAVIALKLLNILNSNDDWTIEKYYAAGMVPPQKPLNIWQSMSDKAILFALKKAGLPTSVQDGFIPQFRNNTSELFSYFKECTRATNCNLSIILNKNDPLTANWKRARSLWGRYVSTVEETHFLSSQSHYFQTTDASMVADILLSDLAI